MKKIAVVLSGSGFLDGSEIHEATLTLLGIAEQGAQYQCFAPNHNQAHVVNHLTGNEIHEIRNVMVEAARIARGNVKPLSAYNATNFDALIFPGGYGAAKNLCTFAFDGIDCVVIPEAEKAIMDTVKEGKPIGSLCVSPVMMVKVLGDITVTIGNDDKTVAAIKSMGGKHIKTTHGEIVVDEKYKIITTPCYMLDASIDQVALGIRKLVKKLLEMA